MKASKLLVVVVLSFILLNASLVSLAQASLHTHNEAVVHSEAKANASFLLSLMELPFLFIAVIFAFLTASSLNGGKFGKGMYLVAWGFVVMAVGHLHMQVEHFYGVNIFNSILGDVAGSITYFVALVATWGLSSLGFYSIYKASKG